MFRKEFIYNELKYRYPSVSGSIRYPARMVGRPLLMEQDGRAPGAHIVVCRAYELNESPDVVWPEPLFLCIGVAQQRVLDNLDVIILPEGEQPSAIINFLQRLFDRLDEWLHSLKQIAETGTSVTQLLDAAAQMLQNPLVLFDSMGHILAWSGSIESEREAARVYDLIRLPRESESGVQLGVEGRALFSELSIGDTRYTLICSASERQVYGSDEVVFESLCGYIRLMLSERKLYSRLRSGGRSAAEQALRSLLSREEPEKLLIERLIKLGWSESADYCILAAEPKNQDLRQLQSDTICALIEARLPDSCAFVAPPLLVAIFPSTCLEEQPLRTSLASLSSDAGVRFGVCESYRGFSSFPHRLELAKAALSVSNETGGIAFFMDTAEEYAVSRVANDTPPELIALRSVFEMARSDSEHGTRYLETIAQYVKNRFNAVKTANALFIHRSTFLYRLDRMKEQFGLDLDSCDVSLLHLLLSLRLAERSRQKPAQ